MQMSYFEILKDLYGTFERVNQSPLGAGPVGGTSIPIDRQSIAEMLGFDGMWLKIPLMQQVLVILLQNT